MKTLDTIYIKDLDEQGNISSSSPQGGTMFEFLKEKLENIIFINNGCVLPRPTNFTDYETSKSYNMLTSVDIGVTDNFYNEVVSVDIRSGFNYTDNTYEFAIIFRFARNYRDFIAFGWTFTKDNDEYLVNINLWRGDDTVNAKLPVSIDLTLFRDYFTINCPKWDYSSYPDKSVFPSVLTVLYRPPLSQQIQTLNLVASDTFLSRSYNAIINRLIEKYGVFNNINYQYEIIDESSDGTFSSGGDYSSEAHLSHNSCQVDIHKISFSIFVDDFVCYQIENVEYQDYICDNPISCQALSYATVDDFLPDFYRYLDYLLECCTAVTRRIDDLENGSEEDDMNYTSQLNAIVEALENIDSRLHIVDDSDVDTSLTQAIKDSQQPIVISNQNLSPWSAV